MLDNAALSKDSLNYYLFSFYNYYQLNYHLLLVHENNAKMQM